MARNVYPMLEGPILAVVDAMQPGELLVLLGGPSPLDHRGGTIVEWPSVSTEAAAMVLLSVFPLDRGNAPISYLDQPWFSGGMPDVAFAVSGIAADAERRRVPLTRLKEPEFARLAAQAVVTVLADEKASPCAFLLRRGKGCADGSAGSGEFIARRP